MAPERITVLSPELADQIAAGEVVERPASVVKELVENAIDAGARRVEVELTAAGLERILVCDDGRGIVPDDLPLAVTRHATSKVHSSADLLDVRTLGFRGEALASIAAVAHVTLESRPAGAKVGTRLRSHPGLPPTLEPVGMSPGTRVCVERLFANVPARRKFMRAESTEVGHCSDTMLRLAVSHPGVHLRLQHQGRSLLDLPGADLPERMRQVLQRRTPCVPQTIEACIHDVRVLAFLGPPEAALRTRHGLFVVVRRRVVQHRELAQIVEAAYGDRLRPGQHPVACLVVDPPPGTVDVNVHPQKSEVRFSDPQRVYAAVREALAGFASVREEPPRSVVRPVTAATEQALDRWGRAGTGGAPVEARRDGFAPRSAGRVAATGRWGTWDDPASSARAAETNGASEDPGTPTFRRRTDADDASEDPGEGTPMFRRRTDADDAWGATEASTGTSEADARATEGTPTYRLRTRAAAPDYAESRAELRQAADELQAQLRTRAAEERREALEEAPLPLPRPPAPDDALSLLTCLPGPVALFRHEHVILAVDLLKLRSHLVYRRLTAGLGGSQAVAQGLLEPVLLSRSPAEVALVVASAPALARLGLVVEAFGEEMLRVRAVPAQLEDCVDEPDVADLIDRVLPWVRLQANDPDKLAEALAGTRGAPPAPRLARRWIRELLEAGASLESIPGVRRWTAEALVR